MSVYKKLYLASLAFAIGSATSVASAKQPIVAQVAKPRSFIEPISDLRFVLIPAGSFEMGSRFGETQPQNDQRWFADEAPPHRVSISRDFWLATTETTLAAFRRFIEETGYVTTAEQSGVSLGAYVLSIGTDGVESGQWGPSKGLNWRNPGWRADEAHPVTHVSWQDANAFVRWLSDKTGRAFRLPTEAEWEYAAGGPDHKLYSWGDGLPVTGREGNIADSRFAKAYPLWKYPVLASLDDRHVHTSPVASYDANGFGLFDMSGNVWEWTADRYAPDIYASAELTDPQGPSSGAERVHRGGGFDWELPYLRVAKRRRGTESMTAINIGFRIAL